MLAAAASVMVSGVVQSGDLVLIRSDSCGWMSTEDAAAGYKPESALAGLTHARWTAKQALDYARNCYGSSAGHRNGCNSYAVPAILSSTREVPCPFSPDICAIPNAFQVDSGIVDSNLHLGINLEPQSRVGFRKVLTCSPILAEEKYSSNWT